MAVTFRNYRLWQGVVGLEVGLTSKSALLAPLAAVGGAFFLKADALKSAR
jgi:hypothetical protein